MPYSSTITFTLDTICPWTYLGRRRLLQALSNVRSELGQSSSSPSVEFNIHYAPYQLYPEASYTGEDRAKWYLKNKYNDSPEQLAKYEALMIAYFLEAESSSSSPEEAEITAGMPFSVQGTIANTLPAHRLLQHVQSLPSEKNDTDAKERLLDSLYRQYFPGGAHPSAEQTLLLAARDAGVLDERLDKFIRRRPDEDDDDSWVDTKAQIREQAGNGVDAVPYVVIEGRRRDFTLIGCKTVQEYEKALRSVVKEAS